MKIKNISYVVITLFAFSACASLQAARIDSPMGEGLYKINTFGKTFNPGDKVSLIKENYREYGKAHDHGNTVILNRTPAGKGIVVEVLDDGKVSAKFEPNVKPTTGMKVEKL